MDAIIPIIIIAAFSLTSFVVVLVTVIAGIHASERKMNLDREPRCRSELIARHVLGVHADLHSGVRGKGRRATAA